MKTIATTFTILFLSVAFASTASAHCQVPCGIYDDHARIHMLQEDAMTIAKAVANIDALGRATDAKSFNQRVRWVQAKEEHASRIITLVSEYFLTQKIKAASPNNKKAWATYLDQLLACHAVMRTAMKTKQTVSPDAVDELNAAIDKLGQYYPEKQSKGAKIKKRKRGGKGHSHGKGQHHTH